MPRSESSSVLVTGGAGFIGSHLVEALIASDHNVRVLDDLCTGSLANLPKAVELQIGSVADQDAVASAVRGVEIVFHLAALRAVQLSVEKPTDTDTVNVHGTLTVLEESRLAGVRRVVCASSSSVYGSPNSFPTAEDEVAIPRSPYAVGKLAGEHYARVFHELYGLETVSLRYFNVYGPRQRPESPYAAVIPLFLDALLTGRAPVVQGDGEQSRDFTYVSDTVSGTLAAAAARPEVCSGRAYNVATGSPHSILDVLSILGRLLGIETESLFVDARPGDVRRSQADPSAAQRDLGFRCKVSFEEGLRRTAAAFTAESSDRTEI